MSEYKFIRWLAIGITVLALPLAFYQQLTKDNYLEMLAMESKVSQMEMRELRKELENVLSQKISEAPKSVELAAFDQKFNQLEERLQSVSDQTKGLQGTPKSA